MYISINWIKDFVDLQDINIDELIYKFTMSTAEVESTTKIGSDIKDIVVGKIIELNSIEGSDKLKHTIVDIGTEKVSCVCGAPNVKVGMLSAFAKVGGAIKNISKIEKTKIKNIESNGILCSAKELGLSDDHNGIMNLPSYFSIGENLKNLLDIDDIIVEIDNKSLTNRPDLWGHYGIAREIAAITGKELKPLPIANLEQYNNLSKLNIEIEDPEKCHRYSSITLDNITTKVSPLNMQIRLFYCGMRGINLLVDLTNYLMLEVGQPMHAFDKNTIKKIIIKPTYEDIKFKTLDDIERTVKKDTLMICNEDNYIGIAGIMGGKFSEVNENTTSILLESAKFEPFAIRKATTKLGIRTEASTRYEKSLDTELTLLALKRFVYLLQKIDKNSVISSSLTDIIAKPQKEINITITKSYIDKYIGQEISIEKIMQILTSLQFDVNYHNETFEIKVPSFRASKDISIKADIIEEITRIYGFDNIIPKPAYISSLEPVHVNTQRILEHKIKDFLAINYGFIETHSHIWFNDITNKQFGISKIDGLKIINPSSPETDTLRNSIVPIMLNFANENRKDFNKFGMFEIGSVFNKINDKEHEEHKELCILIADKTTSENNLFYKAKAIITSMFKSFKNININYKKLEINNDWIHPIKSVNIYYENTSYGYITIIHPQVKNLIDKKLNMVTINIDIAKLNSIAKLEPKFKQPSKYPETSFDLNLVIDNHIPFKEIENTINNFKDELFISYKFIEIYIDNKLPQNKKSMTFNFNLGSNERTLLSEEIETTRNSLIKYLDEKGYKLRT